jgi:hypothetical protein
VIENDVDNGITQNYNGNKLLIKRGNFHEYNNKTRKK